MMQSLHFRSLKPQQYVNDRIISAIDEGKSTEEARKVAQSLISSAAMSNIKATAQAEMDSCGHNFDAVGNIKRKCVRNLMTHSLSTKFTTNC